MAEPQVSVLLPVYNAERYVAAAVRSILEQTFCDFEIIAIDDGSTDGSLAILRELGASDARLRIVSRPNTGYTVALNEAIGLSRASLLARMDADDISLPERFAKQLAYLQAHPSVAAIGTASQFMNDAGLQPTVKRHPTTPADIRKLLADDSAIVHPSVMMRKSAVQELGGYRATFEPAEDYDLWLRLSERFDLVNLPDVLLHYRVHSGQISSGRMFQQIRSRIAAQQVAGVRRASGRDPMQPNDAIDYPTLRRWGADRKTFDTGLIAAIGERIDTLLRSKEREAAALLVEELEKFVMTDPTRWARAQVAWLGAKIDLALGRRVQGAAGIAKACLFSPALITRSFSALGRRTHIARGA